MAITPDGRFAVAAVSGRAEIQVWELTTGRLRFATGAAFVSRRWLVRYARDYAGRTTRFGRLREIE